jgi:hypothetical protein
MCATRTTSTATFAASCATSTTPRTSRKPCSRSSAQRFPDTSRGASRSRRGSCAWRVTLRSITCAPCARSRARRSVAPTPLPTTTPSSARTRYRTRSLRSRMTSDRCWSCVTWQGSPRARSHARSARARVRSTACTTAVDGRCSASCRSWARTPSVPAGRPAAPRGPAAAAPRKVEAAGYRTGHASPPVELVSGSG